MFVRLSNIAGATEVEGCLNSLSNDRLRCSALFIFIYDFGPFLVNHCIKFHCSNLYCNFCDYSNECEKWN